MVHHTPHHTVTCIMSLCMFNCWSKSLADSPYTFSLVSPSLQAKCNISSNGSGMYKHIGQLQSRAVGKLRQPTWQCSSRTIRAQAGHVGRNALGARNC